MAPAFVLMSPLLRALVGAASLATAPALAEPAEAAVPAVPPGGLRPSVDVEGLLQQARQARLSEHPAWRHLGHWREGMFGPRSEADGPALFLAPDGVSSPSAELEATVRGLFAPPVSPEPLEGKLDPTAMHALCRFPARAQWLVQQLGISPGSLPPQACPRFAEFWERMRSVEVTVIFASYHLQSPASAFGHTFLRFDRPPDSPADSDKLLRQAVDYSAATDTNNALVYAVKGLLGGFQGHFHAYPYYYRVREYADIESRDLWEYKLGLTPQQVAVMLAHIWELGFTHFDYWYLSENCSYHMLGLVDAAAGGALALSAQVRWPVLPVDTLKVLSGQEGLLREVTYRPSLRTQFLARYAPLSQPLRRKVRLLADAPAEPLEGLSAGEAVAVLDAATDLYDLRHGEALLDDAQTQARQGRETLLQRRAAHRVPSPSLELGATPQRPDASHGSRRVALGVGVDDRGAVSGLVDFRLAAHDLGDPPGGYPDGGELEFMAARLRVAPAYPWTHWLERLDVVRASRDAAWDDFDRPPSWVLAVGGLSRQDSGCVGCLAGRVLVGGGASFSLGRSGPVVGLQGHTEILGGPRNAAADRTPVALGVGPELHLRWTWGERFSTVLRGRWLYQPLVRDSSRWDASAVTRFHVGKHLSFGLEGGAVDARWRGSALLVGYF